MNIYIAGPFEKIAFCKTLRTELMAQDYAVTSSWLDEDPSGSLDKLSKKEAAAFADRDLLDIRISDALVLYNPSDYRRAGGGGRHFESGYAHAHHIPVIVLGVMSHVFHRIVWAHVETHVQLFTKLNALRMAGPLTFGRAPYLPL